MTAYFPRLAFSPKLVKRLLRNLPVFHSRSLAEGMWWQSGAREQILPPLALLLCGCQMAKNNGKPVVRTDCQVTLPRCPEKDGCKNRFYEQRRVLFSEKMKLTFGLSGPTRTSLE